MRVLRNPVAQFLVAGLVIVTAVLLATDYLSRRAAEREAVADARALTQLLAETVAEPHVPPGLGEADPIAVAAFDRVAQERLLLEDVARIKIWNRDGVIVYSNEMKLVEQEFELSDEARAVLEGGNPEAGLSDLRRPENEYEVDEDGFLEVYTRIDPTYVDQPLLFEMYWAADDMAQNTELVQSTFRPVTIGGLLALLVLAAPLIWILTRRLERAATARERLLRNAVEASEAERRRLARELHEGVVRDLADVTDEIADEASAAATSTPALAQRLLGIDDTLRRNVSSLRTMVLEIYPPDLDAEHLQEALEQLAAPARSAGLLVSVRAGDLGGASRDTIALLWRGAREATRNTMRHARARHLDIRVGPASGAARPGRRMLRLEVADDGVGFVPGAFSTVGRFGLRSLRDLAEEAGGRLEVSSRPGRGTVLVLEVPEG